MAYGAPQPDSERIFAEINAVLTRATRYVPATDWDIKRLTKLAEQLSNADEAEGASALATVWQLTGDRDKALGYIDYAIQHAESAGFYVCGKIAILSNLGYFSEALENFKSCSAPEKGSMTHSWRYGYLAAAFRTMNSYLPKAKKMQFDLGSLDTDTAVRAANVMEKAGVQDEDVARVLDVAGRVLRNHGLLFVGDGLRVNVRETGEPDGLIDISFDIAVSAKEAHALYQEFVDQVLENVPVVPSIITVSFTPWKQQNERNAA